MIYSSDGARPVIGLFPETSNFSLSLSLSAQLYKWVASMCILSQARREGGHSNTLCCLLFIGSRGLVLSPWLVGCNFTFFDVSFASYVLCKGRLVVYFVKHFCLFFFLFLLLFYGYQICLMPKFCCLACTRLKPFIHFKTFRRTLIILFLQILAR